MSIFTELLKRKREDDNLTKVDAAKILGWSPMYYGRYENGYLIPTKNNIPKFARFLNMSSDELCTIIDEISKKDV